MRIIVIVALIAVVAALFTALVFLYRDRGRGNRVVIALAIRVLLSMALIAFPRLLLVDGVDRAHGLVSAETHAHDAGRCADLPYIQYTSTKSKSQTTSTKCQYHAAASKPK
jgi:hypothetical protein